jgi:capsular exopolysaccharide synthesis family protein
MTPAWQPEPPPANPHDSAFEILWRQRRVMLVCVVLAVLIGSAYVVLAPRQYASTSRLIVGHSRPSLLEDDRELPTSDDDNFLSTQREIVSSVPVLALALSSPAMQDVQALGVQSSRFETLKKNLSVEVGKKVNLLSVSYECRNPREATKIVDSVVKAYQAYETNQREMAADGARAALMVERAKWQTELTQKTAELLAYKARHGLAESGTNQSASTEDRLHAVNQALVAARLDTISARIQSEEASRQLAAAAKPGAGAEADEVTDFSPEDLASLRLELAAAKAHQRELEIHFLPEHPAMIAAVERVNRLNLRLVATLKMQLAAAEAKEAGLEKLYDQERQAAIQQNAAATELDRMQSEISRIRESADAVDRKIRETNLSSDSSSASISVLEPAHADEHPTKPQKTTALATSGVAGILAGALLSFVRDRYDRRLSTAADVRSLLRLKALGILPAISREITPSERARQAWLAPDSESAETYRRICSALEAANDGKGSKILLVASPGPGDGRSTVAANLAISFAISGRRTLLVDADLRSPVQDWIFGLGAQNGDSNGKRADDSLRSSGDDLGPQIHTSGVTRLDVLTANPGVSDPVRFLNDSGFADLLEKMADEYDQVVVDSPAITGGPDARILAVHCDATLLVLRAGLHNQRTAEDALASLAGVGARVAGVVLNRQPPASKMARDHRPHRPALSNQARRFGPVSTNVRETLNGFVEAAADE